MTTKSKEKKSARQLQERTGWNYMECLRCVRALMTEAQIEELIVERRASTDRFASSLARKAP